MSDVAEVQNFYEDDEIFEETEDKNFSEVTVSEKQFEEALERVVKKLFSEKIDELLVDIISKTVSEDLNKIKEKIRDDL
jgi:hypothetical protein